MAGDERNFRSSYYEKVGFRSVEEKKSLEILLKDKPLDKIKLKQFSLRFTVPGIYRSFIWKILLEIVPIHVTSHTFVMQQREHEYKDLHRALQVIGLINDDTPKPQMYLLMWLLETGKLRFDWHAQIESDAYHNFLCIAKTVLEMLDNDVEAYWISKGFIRCVSKFQDDVPRLTESIMSLLEKEDNELFRIWDKLASGSCKILVFVALVLLITLRRMLLKCTTAEKIIESLNNPMGDLVV
uniref:TBC1 domain family member 7 n=1 Tax=Timema shepardi TaxID=629360 RepID=A0A7R9G5D5_TIMSH|nr:unnamed protein product [Timema shepardi]